MLKRASACVVSIHLLAGPAAAACSDVRPLVCTLTTDYSPIETNPYIPPPASGCPAAPEYQAHVEAIQGAFELAPPGLQLEICRLKSIFIVTPGSSPNGIRYSWDIWENPRNNRTPAGTKPNSYVALQLDAFEASNLLNEQEDAFLTVLKNDALLPEIAHVVTGVTEEQSRLLAILSVMAHEIGHIKWHRDNVYGSLPCYYDAFIEPSWQKAELPAFLARKWAPSVATSEASGVGAARVTHKNKSVPSPHDSGMTFDGIRRIYDSRPPADSVVDGFVTVAAATSPEEDFVESYKIAVYSSMPALAIELNLPNTAPIDLVRGRNHVVQGKLGCAASLLGIEPLGPSKQRVAERDSPVRPR